MVFIIITFKSNRIVRVTANISHFYKCLSFLYGVAADSYWTKKLLR